MSLLRSIATIGGLTAVSRVFGFVRDTLLAAFLGTGPVADAFFVALRLPNLFRSLFAEGAFSAAFVPIFVDAAQTEGRRSAITFAETTMSVLTCALLLFVVVMELIMPWAMILMAPGFHGTPTFDLVVEFSRITFPYLLFISLVALQGGVLNSFGYFAAAAATPILLNLCLITAVIGPGTLAPTLGHGLAWGVLIAGIVQFLWLIYSCGRAGVWLHMPRPRLTPRVRRLLRRAVPVAVGAGIYQVNIVAGTILASLLPSGSVSYLFYADRLNQLPYGIIGAAVSTALLPLLSRQVKSADASAALASQNRALEFVFFLNLPAATGLILLAYPLIDVLFGRGAFDANAVVQTSAALAAYAVGLPAFMLIKALTPGFYAREDTRTPVRIAAVGVVLNIALGVALMFPLLHVGIALATSIASWVNAALLALVLYRRGFLVPDRRLKRRLPRMMLATALMGAALYAANGDLAAAWFAGNLLHQVVALAALIAIGLATFGLAAIVLGAASIDDIRGLLNRRRTARPPAADGL